MWNYKFYTGIFYLIASRLEAVKNMDISEQFGHIPGKNITISLESYFILDVITY